jgi:transcriptional regulator with XRE-family HTH domain
MSSKLQTVIARTLKSLRLEKKLSQEDLAKNTSQTSKTTFFTIDLSSDDLTFNSVTSDNIVNDVEKDQGVTLSGNAEAGSWIQIRLKNY